MYNPEQLEPPVISRTIMLVGVLPDRTTKDDFNLGQYSYHLRPLTAITIKPSYQIIELKKFFASRGLKRFGVPPAATIPAGKRHEHLFAA